MKLLLDTQCWLWWIGSPERLSDEALEAIRQPENEVFFSVASSWEIGIKFALGKLSLPVRPAEFIPPRLARDGIESLPVQHAHAFQAAELPPLHRDPFDRMLVAQAQAEGLVLVTADPQIRQYEVSVIFAG